MKLTLGFNMDTSVWWAYELGQIFNFETGDSIIYVGFLDMMIVLVVNMIESRITCKTIVLWVQCEGIVLISSIVVARLISIVGRMVPSLRHPGLYKVERLS